MNQKFIHKGEEKFDRIVCLPNGNVLFYKLAVPKATEKDESRGSAYMEMHSKGTVRAFMMLLPRSNIFVFPGQLAPDRPPTRDIGVLSDGANGYWLAASGTTKPGEVALRSTTRNLPDMGFKNVEYWRMWLNINAASAALADAHPAIDDRENNFSGVNVSDALRVMGALAREQLFKKQSSYSGYLMSARERVAPEGVRAYDHQSFLARHHLGKG